jgi:hypothetical protein
MMIVRTSLLDKPKQTEEATDACACSHPCDRSHWAEKVCLGDAKMVVDVVQSKEQDWSCKGHIISAFRATTREFPNGRFHMSHGKQTK